MVSEASRSTGRTADQASPLAAIFVVTFLASISTGVIWSGVSFIAEEQYGYSKSQNLFLYVFMGAIYIVGATTAGRLTRLIERWLSPRAVLAWILIGQALISLGPLVSHASWMLWLVSGVTSVLSALLWPIMESYLTSGRHGAAMRSAIGYFNLVWTSAVACSLLFMAPLLKQDARMAIVYLGAVNVVALVALRWFRPAPGAHDATLHEASIQREYPLLLRSARLLLPLSYVFSAAMNPILPHRLDALGVDSFMFREIEVSWQTPATATWMVLRVLTMAVMWRIGYWHGRWGTLVLGAAALASGFTLVVLGPHVAVVIAGFALFGVGMGVVYYAALYYALAVGRAEVDAGGTHEALIGLGYTLGPLAGLTGLEIADTSRVSPDVAIVAVVCALVALGAAPAFRPYLKARRARSHGPASP